jgi:predicted nucleic acid-binding protein
VTAFADTNVVAYALDDAEPGKQQVARTALGTSPRPRTSPQVLRELYVVACSKLGLSSEDARSAVLALVPTVGMVEDAALVVRAVAAAQRWQRGRGYDVAVRQVVQSRQSTAESRFSPCASVSRCRCRRRGLSVVCVGRRFDERRVGVW